MTTSAVEAIEDILDTSIWVDIERGRLAPRDVAALTGDEPVYVVPPVLAETCLVSVS